MWFISGMSWAPPLKRQSFPRLQSLSLGKKISCFQKQSTGFYTSALPAIITHDFKVIPTAARTAPWHTGIPVMSQVPASRASFRSSQRAVLAGGAFEIAVIPSNGTGSSQQPVAAWHLDLIVILCCWDQCFPKKFCSKTHFPLILILNAMQVCST